MPWYQYPALVAYDAPSGAFARNAEGQVYALTDTSFATPLPVQDLSGVPLPSLVSSNDAFIPPFKVDGHKVVNWKSGPYIIELESTQGIVEDVEAAVAAAQLAQAAAEDAASRAALPAASTLGDVPTWTGTAYEAKQPPSGGSSIQGAPPVWPDTFPPAPHTHSAGQVGATTVGQALMTAADKAAARLAIDAGTGNGTSNLQLGTTASTAAPGNHTHAAAAIGFTPPTGWAAADVQAAIVEAASKGGSGGGSAPAGTIVGRQYAGGAYPIRGTLPAGTIVIWYGPVQPTIGGNYAIAGVDKFVAEL